MNLIDRLFHINNKISNAYITYLYWGICNVVIWLWAIIVRSKKPSVEPRDEKIVISLTSFPKRINYVWLTVRSLLQNSCSPDKVILWLSKDQFPNGEKSLPRKLVKLTNKGLDIRFVQGDIRSYKKYYYAYQEFKDDLVILADDDLIYPSYFISNLYNKWKASEKPCVVFNYAQKIYDDSCNFIEPENWVDVLTEDDDSKKLMAGSGGGLLLCPATLSPLINNKDLFLRLAPYSDDYWIDTVVRYSGLKMYKTKGGKLLQLFIFNNFRLWTVNRTSGGDIIKKINQYMKENYKFEPYPQRLSQTQPVNEIY